MVLTRSHKRKLSEPTDEETDSKKSRLKEEDKMDESKEVKQKESDHPGTSKETDGELPVVKATNAGEKTGQKESELPGTSKEKDGESPLKRLREDDKQVKSEDESKEVKQKECDSPSTSKENDEEPAVETADSGEKVGQKESDLLGTSKDGGEKVGQKNSDLPSSSKEEDREPPLERFKTDDKQDDESKERPGREPVVEAKDSGEKAGQKESDLLNTNKDGDKGSTVEATEAKDAGEKVGQKESDLPGTSKDGNERPAVEATEAKDAGEKVGQKESDLPGTSKDGDKGSAVEATEAKDAEEKVGQKESDQLQPAVEAAEPMDTGENEKPTETEKKENEESKEIKDESKEIRQKESDLPGTSTKEDGGPAVEATEAMDTGEKSKKEDGEQAVEATEPMDTGEKEKPKEKEKDDAHKNKKDGDAEQDVESDLDSFYNDGPPPQVKPKIPKHLRIPDDPVQHKRSADYQILKIRWMGHDSNVYQALHLPTNEKVIMKIWKPMNISKDYCLNHWRRVCNEYTRLKEIKEVPNVIEMLDHFSLPKLGQLKNTYQRANIYEPFNYPRLKDVYTDLPDDEIRLYLFELLKTIRGIHKLGFMHRDINIRNVLVDRENKKIKVIGCQFLCKDNKPDGHGDIGARAYRAPEMLVDYKYNHQVDMWSFGCVMAAVIFQKEPFFKPRRMEKRKRWYRRQKLSRYYDYYRYHQIERPVNLSGCVYQAATRVPEELQLDGIFRRLGVLRESNEKDEDHWWDRDKYNKTLDKYMDEHYLDICRSRDYDYPYHDKRKELPKGCEGFLSLYINEKNKHLACPEALDLLSQCLHYTPESRITAADAIAYHPYFQKLRDPDAVPLAEGKVILPWYLETKEPKEKGDAKNADEGGKDTDTKDADAKNADIDGETKHEKAKHGEDMDTDAKNADVEAKNADTDGETKHEKAKDGEDMDTDAKKADADAKNEDTDGEKKDEKAKHGEDMDTDAKNADADTKNADTGGEKKDEKAKDGEDMDTDAKKADADTKNADTGGEKKDEKAKDGENMDTDVKKADEDAKNADTSSEKKDEKVKDGEDMDTDVKKPDADAKNADTDGEKRDKKRIKKKGDVAWELDWRERRSIMENRFKQLETDFPLVFLPPASLRPKNWHECDKFVDEHCSCVLKSELTVIEYESSAEDYPYYVTHSCIFPKVNHNDRRMYVGYWLLRHDFGVTVKPEDVAAFKVHRATIPKYEDIHSIRSSDQGEDGQDNKADEPDKGQDNKADKPVEGQDDKTNKPVEGQDDNANKPAEGQDDISNKMVEGQDDNANKPDDGQVNKANEPDQGQDNKTNKLIEGQDDKANKPVQGQDDNANKPDNGQINKADEPDQGQDNKADKPFEGQDDNANKPVQSHDDNANKLVQGQDDNANKLVQGQDDNANKPVHGQDNNADKPVGLKVVKFHREDEIEYGEKAIQRVIKWGNRLHSRRKRDLKYEQKMDNENAAKAVAKKDDDDKKDKPTKDVNEQAQEQKTDNKKAVVAKEDNTDKKDIRTKAVNEQAQGEAEETQDEGEVTQDEAEPEGPGDEDDFKSMEVYDGSDQS